MNIKRSQSLPSKTQPTIAPNQKQMTLKMSKLRTRGRSPCPQTSQSLQQQRKSKNENYIHNMRIDYGRLQKPKKVQQCEYSQSQIDYTTQKPTRTLYENPSTKRVPSRSLFATRQYLSLKNTQKKSFGSINIVASFRKTQRPNIETADNLQTASRVVSSQKISLQQLRAHTELMKKQRKKKEMKSRIVQMFVGGGGRKTKLICYPDTSDYHKLCNID